MKTIYIIIYLYILIYIIQYSSDSNIINSQLHTYNVRIEMNFIACNLYLNKPDLKITKGNQTKKHSLHVTEQYRKYIHTYIQISDEQKFKLISRYINKKTITIFNTSVVSPRLFESTDELSISFTLVILS